MLLSRPNITIRPALACAALVFGLAQPGSAAAQDGVLTYRMGRDTVAIERFSRSATRFSGEMVTRRGPTVTRTSYDFTLANGRLTAAVFKSMQADGSPPTRGPVEQRFTFGADSVTRTVLASDGQTSQAFAAANAFPALPVYVYAPYAILNDAVRRGARGDVPQVGLAGNRVGTIGLEPMPDGTMRLRGAPYAMLLRFAQDGHVEMTDGSFTTNKAIGTQAAGAVDIAALAKTMKPVANLSPRMTAFAAFAQGPITINYGSPAVRGRTVWGGTLVPFDTIWRTGANEAAHLATSKTIQLGDMTLAPDLYTLWIQHTRTATWLIVNKQVGQWGTAYDAANDIGRVAMQLAPTPEHVEDFTVTIRSLGGPRGAFDFAWDDKVATAAFMVRP